MLGPKQEVQGALFYDFSLEDHVPADHILRRTDRFVDLSDIRRFLAPFYSSTGRPTIDPELMIRMLLFGYCMGIRSERRLCEDVHLNLAYRWFCRLDLADPVPDHSSFSKNRHGRFRDSDLFRHLFEQVLERCSAEGLVGGEQFDVDASLIKADASRYTKVEAAEWSPPVDAPRAVQEYLDTLDDTAFSGATPVKPNRLFLDAILWLARGASPWRDLPPELGNWRTVHSRFRRWTPAGVWESLFKAFSQDPDFEYVLVDATICKTHADATSQNPSRRLQVIACRSTGGLKLPVLAVPKAA